MVDEKDLQPLKLSDLQLGGVFYLKNDDGTYSTCQITKEDIVRDGERVKQKTRKLSKEGKLYVRINKPFKSFA